MYDSLESVWRSNDGYLPLENVGIIDQTSREAIYWVPCELCTSQRDRNRGHSLRTFKKKLQTFQLFIQD